MNIRYGRIFTIPRKIAKYLLSAIYPIIIRIYVMPNVLSIDETLDKIIAANCSIARFGDGEFLYIIDKLNLPFQRQDPILRQKMMEVLNSNEPSILIGLPVGYQSLKNLRTNSKLTWRSQIAWIYPRLYKYLDLQKTYYNASITRPYIDYQDKSNSQGYFQKLMKIWENREILLVEGEKSRLGVKNDLFEKAVSVQRILAPMHHAFSKYENILNEVCNHHKDKLVLIALGPTATVMSYDLTKKGYQSIDIGNVDIEYEWFLTGATEKIAIKGKYTSEAIGGRNVDDIFDEKYISQIIAKII